MKTEYVLAELKNKALNFTPSGTTDTYALETIKDAIKAAENGSFGVGAVLVDENTGEIVCRGQNKVFTSYRSDMHAEMDLLNEFENRNGKDSRRLLKDLTLFTSLESCPMCLCRIITSGVGKVLHIADDDIGGMVRSRENLPSVWGEISRGRVFRKADCSQELSEIALSLFLLTSSLNDKL